MTLRIVLLSLVASMGFELPSGSNFSRWFDASQGWAAVTMSGPSGHCVEVSKPDVMPGDCRQAGDPCQAPVVSEQPKSCEDKAFEAVSNAIVADFTADLAAKSLEPEAIDPQPVVVEVLEVPAVGLPSGEELATLVIQEEKAVVVAETTRTIETVEVTEVLHERLERISTAVRLTRDAVQAWAEVIQDPVDETSPTH